MKRTRRVLLTTTLLILALMTLDGADALAHSAPSPSPAAASTYTIRNGDNFTGIAARQRVKLGALLKANGLKPTSTIHPGQVLQIPTTAPSILAITHPSTAALPTPVVAPAPAEILVSYLRTQVGKPYKFFTAGPDAFDCSGLVVAGYRQVGVTIVHQSRMQSNLGTSVDWKNQPIVAGDLVFTLSSSDPTQIGHVGIALDSKTWIQASGTGIPVGIRALPPTDKIQAVRRILP